MYKYLCNDCGVDVLEIGDWCMCVPEVWRDRLGLGWRDNLCLACLEKRLGRPLTANDIMPIFNGFDGERNLNFARPEKISDRLLKIWADAGVKFITPKARRPAAKPKRPNVKCKTAKIRRGK
jgi:hypothetical protein